MADARYTVKNIETIAESSDILARLYTLAPDDVIPWHYHSTVTDWYFCLGGTLRIETRAPRGEECPAPGGRYAIAPNTTHRISRRQGLSVPAAAGRWRIRLHQDHGI